VWISRNLIMIDVLYKDVGDNDCFISLFLVRGTRR
jgi:hypothetical protein